MEDLEMSRQSVQFLITLGVPVFVLLGWIQEGLNLELIEGHSRDVCICVQRSCQLRIHMIDYICQQNRTRDESNQWKRAACCIMDFWASGFGVICIHT